MVACSPSATSTRAWGCSRHQPGTLAATNGGTEIGLLVELLVVQVIVSGLNSWSITIAPHHCRIWLFKIKGLAALGLAARVLAALRAAPLMSETYYSASWRTLIRD